MSQINYPVALTQVLGRLSEPAVLMRTSVFCLAIFLLVRYMQRVIRLQKAYEHIPTFTNTKIGGFILGHLEHFWLSGTHLPVTVCK